MFLRRDMFHARFFPFSLLHYAIPPKKPRLCNMYITIRDRDGINSYISKLSYCSKLTHVFKLPTLYFAFSEMFVT